MIDIADIELPIEDSAAGRREALARFVAQVRNGRVQPGLLAFVGDLVDEHLDEIAPRPKGRPKRSREEKFLAWFAVECDPAYARMPRTHDQRFAAVGDLLKKDPSGVEKDAAAFGRKPLRTDFLLLGDQGRHYADLKGMPWPASLETFAQWFEDHREARRAALALNKPG